MKIKYENRWLFLFTTRLTIQGKTVSQLVKTPGSLSLLQLAYFTFALALGSAGMSSFHNIILATSTEIGFTTTMLMMTPELFCYLHRITSRPKINNQYIYIFD